MGESVSFRATRMVYGDTNEEPQGLEVYTYDSDQDLITVFNVDLDGTLTGSFEGDSLSITESLGITINPVNDAPVVTGTLSSQGEGLEDEGFVILKSDLTAIAGDVDGDTLFVKNISAINGVGAFTENADGDFVFSSIDDFNGVAEFTYQIADANDAFALNSEGNPLSITGIFNVNPVDDSPQKIGGAINDLTLQEDGPSTSLGLEGLKA